MRCTLAGGALVQKIRCVLQLGLISYPGPRTMKIDVNYYCTLL